MIACMLKSSIVPVAAMRTCIALKFVSTVTLLDLKDNGNVYDNIC